MAIRNLIPVVTGGALMVAVLALAYARRVPRVTLADRGVDPRFELDPVGPDDGMVEVLGIASGPNPTMRTEAEAITGAGAAWPIFDVSPGGKEPTTAAEPQGDGDLRLSRDELLIYGEADGVEAFQYSALSERSPDPHSDLDLEIDFQELDAKDESLSGLSRERLEELGTEWLARFDGQPSAPAPDDGENTEEVAVLPILAVGDDESVAAEDDLTILDEEVAVGGDERHAVPADVWQATEPRKA